MIRPNRALSALTCLVFTLTAGGFAHAATITLDGQSVTVTLQESGFTDASDTVLAGLGGPQIIGNTPADPIGSILFSHESVNLQNLQIVYNIQGGGGVYAGSAAQCSGSPGCSLWSASADDARFLFSGLSFGSPGRILSGVNLTTASVFGVQIADVTANSFEVIFGSAGVLNGTGGVPALGTITMDLQTAPAPVPLPPSFGLLAAGLVVLMLARRRGHGGAHAQA
ncbi:MAG TPA: hypothetical protein VGD54_10845 [Steroidobacteraceae bacterium]